MYRTYCKRAFLQRKSAADDLIDGHFASGACDPVNVEGAVRQCVMDNATAAAADLFDAAQKQVLHQLCFVCTLCLRKKQDTKLMPITSPNVNRFSKFFHWLTHW